MRVTEQIGLTCAFDAHLSVDYALNKGGPHACDERQGCTCLIMCPGSGVEHERERGVCNRSVPDGK